MSADQLVSNVMGILCLYSIHVYGLQQSPLSFFTYLSDHLETQGSMTFCGQMLLWSILQSLYYNLLIYRLSASSPVFTSGCWSLYSPWKYCRVFSWQWFDIVHTTTSSGPQITFFQVDLAKHIIEANGLCSSLSIPISTPLRHLLSPRLPVASLQLGHSIMILLLACSSISLSIFMPTLLLWSISVLADHFILPSSIYWPSFAWVRTWRTHLMKVF